MQIYITSEMLTLLFLIQNGHQVASMQNTVIPTIVPCHLIIKKLVTLFKKYKCFELECAAAYCVSNKDLSIYLFNYYNSSYFASKHGPFGSTASWLHSGGGHGDID